MFIGVIIVAIFALIALVAVVIINQNMTVMESQQQIESEKPMSQYAQFNSFTNLVRATDEERCEMLYLPDDLAGFIDCLDRIVEDPQNNFEPQLKEDWRASKNQSVELMPEKCYLTRSEVIQEEEILERMKNKEYDGLNGLLELAKEYYEICQIDEGMEVKGTGVSGGINAFFYFQKIDLVK